MENHFATRTSLVSIAKETPIQIRVNPVSKLKRLRDTMSGEQVRHFRRCYGEILDLLDIEVPVEALSALIQFWDNELRIFVFPHAALSLVPEEYASFINMPITSESRGYEYPGHLPSRKNVASLLGLPTDEAMIQKIGGVNVILLKVLIDRIDHLNKQGDWRRSNRIIALAVYGIVLFPRCDDSVDLEAISVFSAVEYHGINPVSAILAETYGSLVMCKAGQGKKLRCCLQLLTVWMRYHFHGKDGSTAGKQSLKDFHFKQGRSMANPNLFDSSIVSNWTHFFANAQEKDIKWKLAGWKDENVLYSCGKKLNVPLVGPRYIVNYNPSLAHAQLAYQGRIPAKELIRPIFIKTQEDREGNLFKAWRHLSFKGKIELGSRLVEPTKDFQLWLKQRVMSGAPSEYLPLDPLQGNDLKMIDQALERKINGSKEICDDLDQQAQKKRKILQEMEKEYVLLSRDLEDLNRKKSAQKFMEVNARLNERVNQLEENLKESEDDLRQALNLSEEKQQIISQFTAQIRANEAQLVEMLVELENAHLKVNALQIEDEAKDELIKRQKEEIKLWKDETERLQKKIRQMAGFINRGIPSYIDLFQETEWRVYAPTTPPEIVKLLTTGRALINDWNAICRIK